MNKILLLLLFVPAVFACNPPTNNPDDDPTENPEDALAESDIGTSGGIIEADGITLIVPPESFSSTVRVQIYTGAESMNGFGDNMVTDLYQIEGIPEDFSKPIEVKLAYSGTLANENYLVVGSELETIESESDVISNALYEASDSAGILVSFIEPLATSSPSEEAVKKSVSGDTPTLILMGITNMLSHETSYFKFLHTFQAEKQKIILLADYMNAAIDTFSTMNLFNKTVADLATEQLGKSRVVIHSADNERYRGWWIEMPKFEMKTEGIPPSYGHYIWQNLLQIEYNTTQRLLNGSSDNEIAALAFTWIYRMCCFTHIGSHLDWFSYGSAIWLQEKYAGEVEYNVNTSPKFAMSPLLGMETGIQNFSGDMPARSSFGGRIAPQQANYGLSMIPFIKYIDKTYTQDRSLFSKILIETLLAQYKTPTEGIISAIEDPEYIWLPGFYKAYMTGELYNISFEHFGDKIHSLDQLNFYREVDTTFYNDADYQDLSARLHKINFMMNDFKEDANLNLKLGPSSLNLNYLTTMAFGLKDSELEFFDHAADLTIPNLTGLKANGYHSIVALVVNSANEPPFKDSLKIELDATMRIAPKGFDWAIFKVKARATYFDNDGGSSEGVYLYADAELRTGEMVGNKFTATWSEPLSDGTSSGTIEIVFDPDRYPRYITSYYVTETRTLSDTRTYTITGENIEFWGYEEYPGSYTYYNSGEDSKDYISSIEHVYSGEGGYGYSTDGIPITDGSSYIQIRMGTEE